MANLGSSGEAVLAADWIMLQKHAREAVLAGNLLMVFRPGGGWADNRKPAFEAVWAADGLPCIFSLGSLG